jgi:membrane protease YdiL (CAAX protease family)
MQPNEGPNATAQEPVIRIKISLIISIAVVCFGWAYTLANSVFFLDRIIASFDSFPRYFWQTMIGVAISLIVVGLLLWYSKEPLHDIGLHREELPRQLGIGVLFGLLTFGLAAYVLYPFFYGFFWRDLAAAASVDTRDFFTDISLLPMWIIVSVLGGGLWEELWRVFALTRFERLAGRNGLVAALVIHSIIFGIGHRYQGPIAAATSVVVGIVFACVYLRKRSLLEAMVAHAVYNVISVGLNYLQYAGQ